MRNLGGTRRIVRTVWVRFRRARLAAVVFAAIAAAAGTAAYASLSAPSAPTRATGPAPVQAATLTFTAFDLSVRGTQLPNERVEPYALPSDITGLWAWRLRHSADFPEAVILNIPVPPDFDGTAAVQVELSVVIKADTGVSTAAVKVRVRADAHSSGELLGPGFEQTVSTSDIGIIEPPTGQNPPRFRYLRVPVTLSGSGIFPGDTLVLAVDRIAPSGAEYPSQLLLSGLALTYQRIASPTAVSVPSFGARRDRRSVVVRWRTGGEAGVAGFNLFRGNTRLNRSLIAASGSTFGRAYSFRDMRGTLASRYWLDVVRLDGSRARTGPVRVAR